MASFLNKAKDKIEATLNKNDNKNDTYGTHENVTHPTQTSHVGGHGHPTGAEGVHASNVGGVQGENYGHTTGLGGVQGDNYGHTTGIGGVQHENYDRTAGHSGVASSGIPASGAYGSETRASEYDNPRSTNAGPHSSNLLNKGDARIDSDRDHRNDPTSRVGGHGNTQQYGDNYGQAGLNTSDTEYPSTTTSGFNSGVPATHHATTHAGHNAHADNTGGLAAATTTGTAGHGIGSNTYDNPQHDPTSRAGGYGAQDQSYGHTTTGYEGGATGTAGDYGSSATPGSGNAKGTAGPHNSNILNKLDPRVDENLDGSKTYGGDKTYS